MFKRSVLALIAFALMAAISAIAVYGQTAEVKEKPRMYTYVVADWVIPRSQWADMDKVIASTQADFEKAFADGTLVGYGDDTTLVHHEEVRESHSAAAIDRDETLGQHFRQPVLQLEKGLLERSLHLRGCLYIEGGRAG